MEMTITAKIKISPTIEQQSLLQDTVRAYQMGCNFVSSLVFQKKELAQLKLHKMTYEVLRNEYSLRSQMAQSVMKTVIARYKSAKSNGHEWKKVQFKKPEYDLVWNRDYSLTKDFFSINTLEGRVKVPFETKGMERYLDGSWSFGTAKLVMKYGKFFLHIPMTKEIESVSEQNIKQVVGVDFGINFVASTYDSQGKSLFFNGRAINDKRSHYKHLRKQLQQKQTSSARRRLQAIGQRETRWQADVNHTVSKALVTRYGANTLFVIEDLSGIRQATERVRVQDRYQTVSWAFYQLRQMLEYKALLHGSKVIAVDPKYTSQTCPKCGHTNRANRNKKKHTFCCKNCSYQSNDDRIGAINLQRKGIEYIVEVTA
ncbi:RNA-guided endonuclease InsQ/TnpB family protein [Brevibacillus sp. SYSU BS000544]|uniref:RNA-guided endonuclease InsQ/TnpB family protein n=1 Tax=Brevibacillus sp. SYSU BS000544 TaxID=3416443 RepID=UPI003CE599DC